MRQTKTLAAIAADIENGENMHEYYNENGAQIKAASKREQTQTGLQYAERERAQLKVKAGQFGTFADFLSYYRQHYRPILQAIADGEDLTAQPAALLRFMAQDLLDVFAEDGDTDQGEDVSEDEDPTLTEAEKRETLCRLWDAAWQQAKADPEGTRVIVETAEEDPSAPRNEFGRYYMIDGSEAESCIDHAGQWVVVRVDTVESPFEVRRPNWHQRHGYADNWTQLMCKCENPANIVRWARLMIDAGRVTDIYADSY